MKFLARLLRPTSDPRETMRPLWHRTVGLAREPEWYVQCGVADTLDGRFDMVAAVTALVMIRIEGDAKLAPLAGPYAEWFVEDMDGQLRQSGVGDLVVGKKIGKLMGTLGGRLGAYRTGLAEGDEVLEEAARRNVTMADESLVPELAQRLRGLHARLAAMDAAALLRGEVI